MRRAPAWVVVVGVVCIGFPAEARADDGFWVTLAAGVASNSTSSDSSEFWFESPHAPPIAVNQLNATGTVQATTGGGKTFFSGIGTPVLLPTTNGYASISSSGAPSGAGLPRFAGGTQASGAPQTGVPLGTADLLSVGLSNPATNGSQVLTVSATDSLGNSLGNGHVTVPNNGWWVIGLGAGTNGTNTPPPPSGGSDGGGTVSSTPVPVPTAPSGAGTVTTPEPATAVLLGIAGLCAGGYRRLRNK